MKSFAYPLVAIAALFTTVAASSAQFSSPHVQDLAKDFDEKVADGKLYFVKFYAPWCGHCKRLAPAWGDLGQSLAKDDDVVIAHVDCTKAKSTCSSAQIAGYPTLKLFYDGEAQDTYRGGRDLASMQDYLKQQKLSLLQETSA